MKIDKRVILGGVVVIGGIILLWLLRKNASASSSDQNGTYPDPGVVADQPAPGDANVPNLPDPGSLPRPRIQRAPAVTPNSGGACCGRDTGCASQGYVSSTATMKLPAQFIDDAYDNLQGVSTVDYSAPAPVQDFAGYGGYTIN